MITKSIIDRNLSSQSTTNYLLERSLYPHWKQISLPYYTLEQNEILISIGDPKPALTDQL